MELKPGFEAIRSSIGRRTPPEVIRQSLLWEMDRTSRLRKRNRIAGWSLAAAMALVLSVVALRQPVPAIQEQASLRAPIEDGFQAVPYASPLAEGEFVRVVHTELAPDTLMRLGVYGATGSSDAVPVDLVVGQDNAPVAVRVNDNEEDQ
jgi:hypothetical protein